MTFNFFISYQTTKKKWFSKICIIFFSSFQCFVTNSLPIKNVLLPFSFLFQLAFAFKSGNWTQNRFLFHSWLFYLLFFCNLNYKKSVNEELNERMKWGVLWIKLMIKNLNGALTKRKKINSNFTPNGKKRKFKLIMKLSLILFSTFRNYKVCNEF